MKSLRQGCGGESRKRARPAWRLEKGRWVRYDFFACGADLLARSGSKSTGESTRIKPLKTSCAAAAATPTAPPNECPIMIGRPPSPSSAADTACTASFAKSVTVERSTRHGELPIPEKENAAQRHSAAKNGAIKLHQSA